LKKTHPDGLRKRSEKVIILKRKIDFSFWFPDNFSNAQQLIPTKIEKRNIGVCVPSKPVVRRNISRLLLKSPVVSNKKQRCSAKYFVVARFAHWFQALSNR
jgi:hypothetical protein